MHFTCQFVEIQEKFLIVYQCHLEDAFRIISPCSALWISPDLIPRRVCAIGGGATLMAYIARPCLEPGVANESTFSCPSLTYECRNDCHFCRR